MKKMLSRSLFAVLAAALVTVALVISCGSPLDGVSGEGEGGGKSVQTYNPPAGKGYIRIKLASNNARTILPDLPDPDDLYYRVVVTNNGTSTEAWNSDTDIPGNTLGLPVDKTTLEGTPITLVAGTFTVKVFAFNEDDDDTVVGSGTDTVTIVTPGTGETANITLAYVVTDPNPSTNNWAGTFSYDITLPSNKGDVAGTFSAVLDVTTYPSKGSTAISNYNLVSNNSSSSPIPLPIGFYYVTITMNDSGTPKALQPRTVTNIMHIYQNIETKYEPILDDLNEYLYTVTYDANGGSLGVGSGPVSNVPHGSEIAAAPANDPTYPPRIFQYWSWGTSPDPAKKWVFGAGGTKLVGNLTLHAIWQLPGLTVNISWPSSNADPSITPNSMTISRSVFYAGTAPQIVEFSTIVGDDSFVYEGWEGEYGDSGDDTEDLDIDGSGTTINYLSGTSHVFLIHVRKGGIPRSVPFTLYVTD
jgi:hypothetical protein